MLVLAARNLFRNTRRTVITLLGIGFGLMFVEVAITLQAGQYAELVEKGVGSLAGHVVVQAKRWQEERDERMVVTGVSAITAALRAASPDATITPRMQLGGLLTSPRGSVGVLLQGIDGPAEASVQVIDDQITQGTWVDGDGRGVVIGQTLADSLQVHLGDKVVYMGQHGASTEVQSRLFRVSGIFRTGSAEFDGFLAFADLAPVQEVYGTPDVAHQVAVHLTDAADTDATFALLAPRFADRPDLDVLPWPRAIPDVVGMIAVDKQSNQIIMFIIGAIVTMGALNTVLMSALERTREFGVMLGLGLRPNQLARLILTEGVLLGTLGAALGLALGLAVSYPLVEYGLDFRGSLGETYESGGVLASGLLQGRYNLPRGFGYALIAVLMTTLAAVYPAFYVSRLQPVAAMRHT